MIKHKNKIIEGAIIAIVLALIFWYGGDAPGLRGWKTPTKEATTAVQTDITVKEEYEEAEKTVSNIPVKAENESATEENKPQKQDGAPMTSAEKIALAEKIIENAKSSEEENLFSNEIKHSEKEKSSLEVNPSVEIKADDKIKASDETKITDEKKSSEKADDKKEEKNKKQEPVLNEASVKDKYHTDPVPYGKPLPIEPESAIITDNELTCTLSVRCDTILNNMGWLDAEKVDIVPKDGVIYAEKTVTFYEGESVFNILMREMKRNKIHMEFENVPMYNSAYIEGIANLYEFDCGELSGWMYKVNGWFPNYGCSRYQLKAGDKVEWIYTCDLGIDIGGYSGSGGNNKGGKN